ncbi:MAG: hypothetical protein HUK25_06745, partial [Treponema sp.]|nr:hypothetical protein [Treponema sp.]
MNKNENYTKEQDALREKYTKEGIPYVVLQWSESHVFPDEDRVYTLREF